MSKDDIPIESRGLLKAIARAGQKITRNLLDGFLRDPVVKV